MKNPIRIFFDVDGVLIDGFHIKPERQKRWDKNLKSDLGLDPARFSDFFIRGAFKDVLHGRLNLEEELDRWLKQNDSDLKAWQVIQYWHKNDSNLNAPVYGVVEKLSKRPDIALYVATNQTHDRARYLWNDLEFKKHFQDIYYSARLGCLKHDSEYFRQVEDDLKFDPRDEQPLYFDDDPKNIEVSSARGWNAVLVDGSKDVTDHPLIRSLLSSDAGR